MHFPTYRQQGLLIAAGYPMVDMMNQVLSNEMRSAQGTPASGDVLVQEYGFFSISGNLATRYVRRWAGRWLRHCAATPRSLRRGSAKEQPPRATPRCALVRLTNQAPVILNIVNNHWAISRRRTSPAVRRRRSQDRGFGFSIPALRVDGNDYLAVHSATQWAAERAWTKSWTDAHRVGHASCGCALDLRRPERATDQPTRPPTSHSVTRSIGFVDHPMVNDEWDDDRHSGVEQTRSTT